MAGWAIKAEKNTRYYYLLLWEKTIAHKAITSLLIFLCFLQKSLHSCRVFDWWFPRWSRRGGGYREIRTRCLCSQCRDSWSTAVVSRRLHFWRNFGFWKLPFLWMMNAEHYPFTTAFCRDPPTLPQKIITKRYCVCFSFSFFPGWQKN